MSAEHKLEPEKWIERYADALFSYTFSRINRQDVAEDLVQDTFFSALKAKDTFRNDSSEKTWLIAILKRKIIDYYRKKSTQNELNIFDKPEEKDGFMNHFFDSEPQYDGHWNNASAPKEWKKDFDTKLESDEFYEILNGCLGKLPEKWAAVFTLKNMDDLDSEEICKELGISPSNYWVLMHRAKLQLRECMDVNWFEK
ncbi:MAG: putative polymerase sigma factor [Bacteroidota bacterium]|nr:putative polymerase sigma factor [Bacteroidota bacterium]